MQAVNERLGGTLYNRTGSNVRVLDGGRLDSSTISIVPAVPYLPPVIHHSTNNQIEVMGGYGAVNNINSY